MERGRRMRRGGRNDETEPGETTSVQRTPIYTVDGLVELLTYQFTSCSSSNLAANAD